MRYAIIEYHGLKPNRRMIQVYRDLSLSSANDMVKAWGYQAGYKGGWMSIVKDIDEIINDNIYQTELNK